MHWEKIQSTFNYIHTICATFPLTQLQDKNSKGKGSCEWVDHNLEVVWVEVEQILQLKLKLFV